MEAKPKTSASVDSQAIQYLDGDAAIVLGIDIGQLQSLFAFSHHASPNNSAAINLAALAATTIVGWNPTRTEDWKSRGFDLSSPALLQIATPQIVHSQPGTRLDFWRTRLVMKSSDIVKSIRALQAMRLRQKASITKRPRTQDIAAIRTLLKIDESEAKRAHERFRKAGVFAIASLSPLDGLLVASAENGYLLLDFLLPHNRKLDWNIPGHRDELFAAIARRPNALSSSIAGIDVLTAHSLGMWIQPREFASLMRHTSSGKRQTIACSRVGALVKQSPFLAVSGQLRLKYQRRRTKKANEFLQADLHWHWASTVPWKPALALGNASLGVHSQSLFRLDFLLDAIAGFQLPSSTPDAWLPLWKAARDCGNGSKILAAMTAWPEILGALLSEITSLHPKAKPFLQSLGVASLWIAPTQTSSQPPILAEAWLRSPGDAIARDWLSIFFGKARKTSQGWKWGQGPIQPYAIKMPGGSVVGAGFSSISRKQEIPKRAPREPMDGALLRLSAQPRKLVRAYPKSSTSMRPLAALWSKVVAKLTLEGRSVHLRFRAE